MKIYKLNQIKSDIIDMISEFENESNSFFLKSLQHTINANKELSNDQFAVLYYMASILRQTSEANALSSRRIVVVDTSNFELFDYPGMTYTFIQQRLYISLILSKPNGKAFIEGSSEFSDAEYEEMNGKIMDEIKDMAYIAGRVLNIDLVPHC